MTSNNDDPKRDRSEDNPFIAFRRFADSQVSSLLNTVFTLPATLANYNNAYHARETCLFGQGDKEKCRKLVETEKKVDAIRSEGRELFRVGDVQAVLQKGEELMRLDREADVLRREILENSRERKQDTLDSLQSTPENGSVKRADSAELVERVANQKGQEWGWSWSWGFPKPFDAAEDQPSESNCDQYRARWRQRREEMLKRRAEQQQRWEHKWKDIKEKMNEELPRDEHETQQNQFQGRSTDFGGPEVWHWSFSWPPAADAQRTTDAADCRSGDLFEELKAMAMTFADDMTMKEVERMLLGHDDAYNPRRLYQDEALRKTGIDWEKAFDELRREEYQKVREARQNALAGTRQRAWNAEQQDRSEYPKRVPWEIEESSEEPSYEYGHDHEDQHDEPPSPKPKQGEFYGPSTELEAYERLLAPSRANEASEGSRPSVLSTLTTTERSVAPDGTVTTKVVLKKRFADGREESSETVHTERGQKDYAQKRELKDDDANGPLVQQDTQKKGEKRNGWFWSN